MTDPQQPGTPGGPVPPAPAPWADPGSPFAPPPPAAAAPPGSAPPGSAPQDAWSGQSAAWSAEPAAWSAQPAPPAVGGPAASGQPGAWTGQPGPAPAGYPGYPYLVVARPTNGLAIASLVVSIVAALGLCAYGVGGVLGIPAAIMGHVARRQVRERGEQGDGFALAAVVVGWIATAIAVLAIIAWIIFIVVIANSDDATVTAD